MSSAETSLAQEHASLRIGKYGNLLMGVAGVAAAILSNSQAVLVDGLFSLIGVTAAIFAARVGRAIRKKPDIRRPLGYAADESLFTTFRALSLLGLVAYAATNSAMSIVSYISGDVPTELNYRPLFVYFGFVILVCTALAVSHFRAWKATGRQSRMLHLEAKAAMFDGLLSLAAGGSLAIMAVLRDGPLGWLTPIGDSIVVLGLCAVVVGKYSADFRTGLNELVGTTAPDADLRQAEQAAAALVSDRGGHLVDLSAVRYGRRLQVQIYLDPGEPISAREADDFTRACDAALGATLGPTTSVVLISSHGRYLPPQAR